MAIVFTALLHLSSLTFGESVLLAALAKVNDRVITTREMQATALVSESFTSFESLIGAKVNPFEEVMLQQVIYIEAQPFEKQLNIEQKKIKFRDEVKKKLKTDSLWKKFSVTDDELHFLVDRRLIVEEFLNFKFDPQLIAVNQKEIETFYKFNSEKYGDRKLIDVRDGIKEALRKQKRLEVVNDWIAVIKKRVSIYYYNNSEKI